MFLPPSVQWPSVLQCDLGAIQLATSRRINNAEPLNYFSSLPNLDALYKNVTGCVKIWCRMILTEKIHAARDNALWLTIRWQWVIIDLLCTLLVTNPSCQQRYLGETVSLAIFFRRNKSLMNSTSASSWTARGWLVGVHMLSCFAYLVCDMNWLHDWLLKTSLYMTEDDRIRFLYQVKNWVTLQALSYKTFLFKLLLNWLLLWAFYEHQVLLASLLSSAHAF